MLEESDLRKYALAVLEPNAGQTRIVDTMSTRKNKIVKAQTEQFGTVCLKISSKVFEAAVEGQKVKYPRFEIDIFKLLGPDTLWGPKLITHADDFAWFMRDWTGDLTLERLKKQDWTADRLRQFWLFMVQVLSFFHELPEPLLIRDIKPQNISFDGQNFHFFDFNAANTLKVCRSSSRASRAGNHSNLSMAPEIVQSDLAHVTFNSDYFSFASLMYRFIARKSAWTNSVEGLVGSRHQYLKEYSLAVVVFAQDLRDLGFGREDRDFLCKCLHPDPEMRPNQLQAPQ